MNNHRPYFKMKSQPPQKTDAVHVTGGHALWASARAGFTMVELIITLAIAAVLVSVAAPSVQSFFGMAKLTGRTSALQSAINFGRSEAIKRGAPVGLCSRSTDTSCGSATDWSQGWIVFSDTDTTGTQGGLDAGEEVLRIARFPGSIVDVSATAIVKPSAMASVDSLRFNARGLADWTVGTYVLCDSRGSLSALALVVNGAGVVRAVEGMGGLAAIDASGTEVTC